MSQPSMWLRRVWIPFWVLQITVCILASGVGGLASYYHATYSARDWYDDVNGSQPFTACIIIWLPWGTISAALCVTEIVLFSRHKLRPILACCFTGIKLVLWTASLIAGAVIAPRRGGIWAANLVCLVLFGGAFVYSVIVFLREKRNPFTDQSEPSHQMEGLQYQPLNVHPLATANGNELDATSQRHELVAGSRPLELETTVQRQELPADTRAWY